MNPNQKPKLLGTDSAGTLETVSTCTCTLLFIVLPFFMPAERVGEENRVENGESNLVSKKENDEGKDPKNKQSNAKGG